MNFYGTTVSKIGHEEPIVLLGTFPWLVFVDAPACPAEILVFADSVAMADFLICANAKEW